MSKQDGAAVRTAADLERKYQFGKQFSEVMGLINDARGTVSQVESSLISKISDVQTSIKRTAEEVTTNALREYTTTDGINKLLETELRISADGIMGEVSQQISDSEKAMKDSVDAQYGDIKKCFTFDLNGLALCAFDEEGNQSPNKVVIDNDDITIYVNNVAVQQFKADGTSLIPVLNITKQLNVCGLSVTEDDTHINIDFVG